MEIVDSLETLDNDGGKSVNCVHDSHGDTICRSIGNQRGIEDPR